MIDDSKKLFRVFSIDTIGTKKPEQFLYLEEKNIYFFVRIPETINYYFCSKISTTNEHALEIKLFLTDKVSHERTWFFDQKIQNDVERFWNNQRDLYLELSSNFFKYTRITKIVNEFLSNLLKKYNIEIAGAFTSFTKPFRDIVSKNNLLKIVDIIEQHPEKHIEQKKVNQVSGITMITGLKVVGKIELPENLAIKKNGGKSRVTIQPVTFTSVIREIVKNITIVRKGSTLVDIKKLKELRIDLATKLIEKNVYIQFKDSTVYQRNGSSINKKTITVRLDSARTVTSTAITCPDRTMHDNKRFIIEIQKIIRKINLL